MKYIVPVINVHLHCNGKWISYMDLLATVAQFNISRSTTLQELVKLGVDLSKWEKKKGVASFALRLDFENDVKQYIT